MKRILIIDDEPAINKLLKYCLASEGYIVDTAGDGKEGVTMGLQTQYDLIISDLSMPYLDGIDAVKRIRAKAPNKETPFMFMSASASEEMRQAVHASGAVALFDKPLDLLDFVRGVAQAMRKDSLSK